MPHRTGLVLSDANKAALMRFAQHAIGNAAKGAAGAIRDKRNKQQQAMAKPRRRTAGITPTAIVNQPRAGATEHGIMPDPGKFHWGQTPASSNVIAPRGYGYYDAFANPPGTAVTAMSVGPATPITSTSITSIDTLTAGTWSDTGTEVLQPPGAQLLIVYPSLSPVQAALFTPTPVATAGELTDEQIGDMCAGPDACNEVKKLLTGGSQLNAAATGYSRTGKCLVRPFISQQLLSDPPANAIPTRCSFRLRNVSEAVAVGGVIRTLRITTGFRTLDGFSADGGYTNAELQAFIESIKVNPRTRHYDAAELRHTQQKNCSVVNQTRAVNFSYFNPESNNGAASAYTFRNELVDPGYTPIAVVFEPFAAQGDTHNKYELNIVSQFLSHYVQGSMLNALAVDPRADAPLVNKHRDHEEKHGSSFLPMLGTALAGAAQTALPYLVGAASKALPYAALL